MTPVDEHTALVAAVTEMLRVAEAAEARYFIVANLSNAMGPEGNPVTYFSATHGPAWAIAAHRQALETLARHKPNAKGFCGADGQWSEWHMPWPCPEVAGVRAVYLPEAES